MNGIYDGVYIPNLSNDGAKYGIAQYRFAHNYELIGKKLNIKAGDKTYALSFDCCCEAVFNGEKVKWECEKLSADMYFVRLGCDCAAFDMGSGLVTFIFHDSKTPVFGVIDGFEATGKQAPAGDEMVGTNVRWVFGADRYVNQEFIAEGKLRSAWSKYVVNIGRKGKSFRDFWEIPEEDYQEEDAREVKLGGPFYLVDIDVKLRDGVCAPAETERLVLLQDYDRMMTVGCAFGSGMEPMMLAGYAKFLN